MPEKAQQNMNLAANALVEARNAISSEYGTMPGAQEAIQMIDDALGLLHGANQKLAAGGQQPGQAPAPSAPTTPTANQNGGDKPGNPGHYGM